MKLAASAALLLAGAGLVACGSSSANQRAAIHHALCTNGRSRIEWDGG